MNTTMYVIKRLKWNLQIKDNTYVNYNKEINDKDPKFQVFDRVRISSFKNVFAIGYYPNWSEQVFVIKNVNNAASWTYTIIDLNGEEIIGTFYEKKLKKQIKKKKSN